MTWPVMAGDSQDLLPPSLSTCVANLRGRRRYQRLRTWATLLAVLTVGAWVVLVAMASLGH